MFLPVADAVPNGSRTVVIAPAALPTAVQTLVRYDSREELWRKESTGHGRSKPKQRPVREPLPWPSLVKVEAKLSRQAKGSKRSHPIVSVHGAIGERVAAARRVYEPLAVVAGGKKHERRAPSPQVALDPLDRIKKQQHRVAQQQSALAKAVESRMDDASRALPIQFLLEHQNRRVFAERLLLLTMCRILDAHYGRVTQAAWRVWKKRTLTLRILEEQERKLFLLRQTSLAHACAIVQRHILTRNRSLLLRWKITTDQIRWNEHMRCARRIQRCWCAWRMQRKLKTLALQYRERVRYDSAVCIQSATRRFLACCELERVVWANKRHTAAVRVQRAYRNYVVLQIAKHHRQELAAVSIQRIWRGHRGRRLALFRRWTCRSVVVSVVNESWVRLSVASAVVKHASAVKIQRLRRVYVYRCQVNEGVQISHKRRRYFPATRIQRAWRTYRSYCVQLVVEGLVFRVVVTHMGAARRIQHCFRTYWEVKINRAVRTLTQLFRRFSARRQLTSSHLVPTIQEWQSTHFRAWWTACERRSASMWWSSIVAIRDSASQFLNDQASPVRRLNVSSGLRLWHQLQQFERSFTAARARQIQLTWRFHRLRILTAQLRAATLLLQRAIPVLFQQFKRRRQRQRVLQRWRRLRYVELHSRFEAWKLQYLVRIQARDLAMTARNVRKALWFHHHKLRQKVVRCWRAFVLHRRFKRRKINLATAHATAALIGSMWRAWRNESLPVMCCANRIRELAMTLTVWRTWMMFVKRKRLSRAAREHYQRCLIRIAFADWRQDQAVFTRELELAHDYRIRHLKMQAFVCLARYVGKEKQVRAFCRNKLQSYGLRHWFESVYTAKRYFSDCAAASMFRNRRLTRSSWTQWIRYRRHQLLQRQRRQAMTLHYERRRVRQVVTVWAKEIVPLWRDYHLILSVALAYRSRRLKERYFREGFRRFWELTAGARRVAMAVRIQRMFRSNRAQKRIVFMRLKIKYQLDTRASMGMDVRNLTSETFQAALETHEWVFVLFSLPWAPVPPRSKEAFCKTATTWSFLRKQSRHMLFGVADATELISFPGHSFSLMTWFGLQPVHLPCVVGFWQGVGPAPSAMDPVCRLANGETIQLKRRFKLICGAASTSVHSLVYPVLPQMRENGVQHVAMSHLVQWIERVRDAACEATAIDLQSYVRGFLTRRRTKRYRVIKNERQKQRVRQWCNILIARWTSAQRQHAVSVLQTWIRHVLARRKYWSAYWREVNMWKRATLRVQHAARIHLGRKRTQRALVSLLATPQRYPNAPLCQVCPSDSEALARLRCRDCDQAFCVECFARAHKSGKRLRHVCDNIDFVAFNDPLSPMCNLCEVRRTTRFCSTCEASQRCAVLCTSCFEAKHTDELNGGISDPKSKHKLRRSWWESTEFREHSWRRTEPPVDVLDVPTSPASAIVDKYSWQSKITITRKQLEAARVEESMRNREEKLLAIRVQQEAILRDAFERYDTDQSGAIDRNEFKRMFKEELCEPLSDEQVNEAMKHMDESGNGLIEFDELLAWFVEDVLAKEENGVDQQAGSRSLAMLKDALRAKRQIRRYKEKLNEFVPTVSVRVPKSLALSDAISQFTERKQKKPTVPGFPSIECLEHTDFARKRKVFNRFLKEICNLDWIYEDEAKIPIANAMEVFDNTFVPRWNAGDLTYDFYFDDESFQYEGEVWERKWLPETKKYVFTTTRRTTRQVEGSGDHGGHHKGSRKHRKRMAEKTETTSVEVAVEIFEYVDPRRKQMLMEEAQEAFKKADTDNSGFIDEHEFHRMLTLELCEPVSKAKAKQIMKQLDADGSGRIDFHEFFQWYAAEKCQEYPMTPQMARARALLQTRRRAKATAAAAVHAGVSSGLQLKEAFARKRKEQQLARDCKGASPELIDLLQEGYAKPLAEKALTLHNQDVAFARQWLRDRQEQEQQERDDAARARADKKAKAKKAARETKQNRRQRMETMRKTMKLLLVGPSKKEAHAARMQQALSNLDREIELVERQLAQ